MTTRSRFPFTLTTIPILVAAVPLWTAGCGAEAEAASGAPSSNAPLPDQPLAAYQVELLDLAFEAASALPAVPHIKNRSRAQESVVETCLELHRPRQALAFVERIDNWRRGAGYASLAFYCAQNGGGTEVEDYLDRADRISEDLARKIADTTDDESLESAQDWQRDRIRAEIASTYVWLGMPGRAAPFEAGIVDSEAGRVDAMKVQFFDGETFDQHIDLVDGAIATGSLDRLRNALQTCVAFFDRFYSDEDRRARAEAKIEACWGRLPLMVRIELALDLVRAALDNADSDKAIELLDECRLLLDGSRFAPEDRISLSARMAELRHEAGDAKGARDTVDAALALFDEQRDLIVDIERADALRPLAEAHRSLGDTTTALALYRRAVEEGVSNPNSRPRAEDLAATCCSMALHEVEPDAALRERLLEVRDALGDPW